MQLKTKAGLTLVVLGIGIFGAWNLWTKTRSLVPLDIPVSLTAGQIIASEFTINFDGLYLIEIEAEKTIPLDTLHCLMGGEADPALCKDVTPAIAATWVLSSPGQEIKRGNSSELHSAPVQSDGVARVIGEFQGKAGQDYTLQVTFSADGGNLAAAHPRLKVGVASIAYTDFQSASVLVFSMAFICVLFGAILLAIAYYARKRVRAV
ncbi:MAG: hypothetical protein WBQ89_13085 [Candidatus Acidiferrum sp.]